MDDTSQVPRSRVPTNPTSTLVTNEILLVVESDYLPDSKVFVFSHVYTP
jgi:hypothetical protein